MRDEKEILNRWRLALGRYAEGPVHFSEGSLPYGEMDQVLEFLYSREYGEEQEIRKDRGGSGDPSSLTVPSWIEKLRRLFPKSTAEIMERHALEKYNMTELFTDPEVLKRMEPNRELLKMVLELKSMMKGPVLEMAREVVKKVAEELTKELEQEIRPALTGRMDRFSGSPVRSMRNLDIKKTIRMNLKHYDVEKRQLLLDQVYFYGRLKRHSPWNVIICVDESGSMMDSVIHSAVMAGIFARLPVMDVKLVIFDTSVVDLSGYVEDPVETLMSIQLGGGTDIEKSVAYCQQFMENPGKTLFFLVSDLMEGGNRAGLLRRIREMKESGVTVVCLLAIADGGKPYYDEQIAGRIASMDVPCFACNPQKMPELLERALKGQDLNAFQKELSRTSNAS